MKGNKLFLYVSIYILFSFAGCTKNDSTGNPPSPPGATSNDYKPTGSSAKDILSTQNFTILKIDIKYMPGYAPDATAINNLTGFLNTYINKSGGISVSQQQIAASGKSNLTIEDVVAIEKNTRTSVTANNQIAINILITDGAFSTANVLGVAYYNTSLCLFGKTINDNSGGVGQTSRTKLQTTVLEHEVGHLLGLVDLGSPMQTNHKDAAHGNHCNNSGCLMYYTSETTDILGFLLTGAIPTLDANCIADLKANGGK